MAKTEEKYSPQTLKSAREHEEWIRGVIRHENKWSMIHLLIGLVNGIFLGCIIALFTLAIVVIVADLMKASISTWIAILMLIVGLLCVVKLALMYPGSKWELINYHKTPLFIDKIDKKEVKDE
jgi:uncharacterized membrane protein YdbT with pleckstrin-like domain